MFASKSYVKKEITIVSNDCSPPESAQTLTATVDASSRVILYRQLNYGSFLQLCGWYDVYLSSNPDWVQLDMESYELVIKPPNYVRIVDNYSFYLNVWPITLTVLPPCDSKNIQGLDEEGVLTLTLSE